MPDLLAEYGNDLPLRLPRHTNPGLEIVYIKKGNLSWECESSAEPILPESIFFTLPWQEHGSTRTFESSCELYFMVIKLKDDDPADRSNIRFKPELGFSKETEEQISQLLCGSSQHAWPASPVMRTLMPEILTELMHPSVFHSPRMETLLKQVILELARTIEQGAEITSDPTCSAWRVNKLLNQLETSYEQKWTLGEMADESGLKRTQFSELFKYTTGESPLNYLTSLRIGKAIQMLEETDRSVTDIAMDCGFSSSQHFANIFKKKTRKTPLKYRKEGPPDIQVPRKMNQKGEAGRDNS